MADLLKIGLGEFSEFEVDFKKKSLRVLSGLEIGYRL